MSNYVKWTTNFLLCIAVVFPHEVKSDGDNVATFQTLLKKEISDNVANPNVINSDLLGITQDATEFTGSSKPRHIDGGTQRINSENSFGNVGRYGKEYLALFENTNPEQLSEKEKHVIKKLTGIYTSYKKPNYPTEGRRDDSTGIRRSPVLHAKDVGDYCWDNVECPFSSECKGSKCVCFPHLNYKEHDHMCLPANNGDNCTTELECPIASICKNSKCSCPSRFIDMGNICIPELDECKNDSDCWEILNNATCFIKVRGNYCSCKPSEISTSTQCLPRVNLGDSCEDQLQCPRRSNCENGTCVCQEGYVNKTNRCLKKRMDECHNDSDCDRDYLKNSYCNTDVTGNFCLCPSGHIISETECLPKVKNGDACKISDQCSTGSACINDTCVCGKYYIKEGLNCVKQNLGSCIKFIACPENSKCVNGFCVCNDGYVNRDQECVKEPVDNCYNDNDCLEYWKNSTCVIKDENNECQCPSGYVFGIHECLPKRNNGESCQMTTQCPWTSLCENSTCVCRDRFITKDNKCVRREVGDPCHWEDDCPLYSNCDLGFCTCQNYYTAERGGCVKSKLGNSCNHTKECPLWDLCHEGTCVCNHGYEVRNGICAAKFVGGYCDWSLDCPEKTFCSAGRCVCKSSYIKRGLECVSTSSGLPIYVWAIIGAAFCILIMCIAAAIVVVRRRRIQAHRNALPHNESTVSSMVESRYPDIPPPSYETLHPTPKINEKDFSSKT